MWKPKFLSVGFGRTFWSTITIEIFERGAWYSFFAVAPLYLTGKVSEGALGLTHAQKGTILGVIPFFLYVFPTIAGTLGDKFGYKRVLMTSLAVMSLGYYTCSLATGYTSFFIYFMLVAIGAGMFKPMVTSTVAQVARGEGDDDEKSSLGFGIFYMVVNLGGFLGPIIGGLFRPTFNEANEMTGGSWNTLFYLASAYMAVMFFWTAFTYKEPTIPSGKSLGRKLAEMFTDLRDAKLVSLLIILVGFWTSFISFFYIMPSWLEEWVDTSSLASLSIFGPWVSHGQVKPEVIVNLNALTLILLSVYISGKVAKLNLLKVINFGTLIMCLSIVGFVFTTREVMGSMALWVLLPAIFTFSIGEIMSSPRSNELMGRIAPKDKIGTYQGYMFLSTAGGFLFAGKLSGLYGQLANKVAMYGDLLKSKFGMTDGMLEGKGVHDLAHMITEQGLDINQVNADLWANHNPYYIWLIPAAISLTTVILLIFYRMAVPNISVSQD